MYGILIKRKGRLPSMSPLLFGNASHCLLECERLREGFPDNEYILCKITQMDENHAASTEAES